MSKGKPNLEDHDPGESQADLAVRQASAPAAVQAIAATHADAASNRVLQPRRLTPAETAFNRWHVVVDPDVTQADLVRPSFWAHHTQHLRRDDEVTAKAADGSFRAVLIVRAVGPKDALMHVVYFAQLEAVSPDALDVPSGYTIDWAGDIAKFRVRRGKETLREKLESRAAASTWLRSHLQSMSR
jgi:hypothetical protein